jgi:hypothetical protein
MTEAELLDDLRPRTFAIAYRMLGSVDEQGRLLARIRESR